MIYFDVFSYKGIIKSVLIVPENDVKIMYFVPSCQKSEDAPAL
jgi:hypothetical protein